jgi:hypothetical protein
MSTLGVVGANYTFNTFTQKADKDHDGRLSDTELRDQQAASEAALKSGNGTQTDLVEDVLARNLQNADGKYRLDGKLDLTKLLRDPAALQDYTNVRADQVDHLNNDFKNQDGSAMIKVAEGDRFNLTA